MRQATISAMREKLAALEPLALEILDESHKHAGHAGARDGGGHFHMTIVSPRFAGLRTMERQRLVYDALGSMMKNEIHALSMDAKSPEETA